MSLRACVQVRDYLLALESHLSEAHRQASRLTFKEVELGEAVLEFGQVVEARQVRQHAVALPVPAAGPHRVAVHPQWHGTSPLYTDS
jgi:hypothetical protein